MTIQQALAWPAALLAALLVSDAAGAQSWPDRSLRFVASAPAGSSLDVIARTIGERLRNRLAQPVAVDNRPAAGGTVAADIVAKSPPDLLMNDARVSSRRARLPIPHPEA